MDYLKHTVPAFDVYITLFLNKSDDNNETTNDFGFDVEIKRRIFPYVIQYYLPCASIVVVSSVSFIIPLTEIPGRVSLVVTLFLALSSLIHEVSIPTTRFTKTIVNPNNISYHCHRGICMPHFLFENSRKIQLVEY